MSKKLLGKITIDEYITGMFPCTCASFYSERNNIDPHCFSCHSRKRLKQALIHIRERSMSEAKYICNTTSYINEKGGITIPPFVDIEKDMFYNT